MLCSNRQQLLEVWCGMHATSHLGATRLSKKRYHKQQTKYGAAVLLVLPLTATGSQAGA